MTVSRAMEGYAKVAQLMAIHGETAILRSFASLGFRNVLYLQAELIELEAEHQALAKADKGSLNPCRTLYDKHWWLLSRSELHGNGEQWQKWLEIRSKLKEFCEVTSSCLFHLHDLLPFIDD